jgi:hypothetical protein
MSTAGSYPYNQGEKHPSMKRDHDDRVHSGGLPTITVPSTVLDITVESSQSRKYIVQAWRVPSRAIREKIKGGIAASPCLIWIVAYVMYPNMTVVTLATPI